MSPGYNTVTDDQGTQQFKRRRIQGACDICSRRKVKCDGGLRPGGRCTNCKNNKCDCTYVNAAKKRVPPKGYVESIENRLNKMEAFLHKITPGIDLSQEFGYALGEIGAREGAPSQTPSPLAMPPPVLPTNTRIMEHIDDDVEASETLGNSLKQMQIDPSYVPFFGRSSSVMFVQSAIEAKHVYSGTEQSTQPHMISEKRPQFWGVNPWMMLNIKPEPPHQEFPDEDLMFSLIGIYFDRVNNYVPLLHRPTFENSIRRGLHLRDEGFGSTLLLVCAIGSRFSDDPRVFLEGSDSTHSAGWAWFRQVQQVPRSMLAAPRLFDLQMCALTVIFLGSSAPQTCWTIIGLGIRLAQDLGAHRRKVYSTESKFEEELSKRAFWVLIILDRGVSMELGRTCALQDEDFDLDLPIDCDDEYWTVSDTHCEFNHPKDKPSKVAFFNCATRLSKIMAFALRTIYATNKSKLLLGFVGPEWEKKTVAELDSALNEWIDSVPDHLRWDPHRESDVFLHQSAYLYAHYYQLQIAVHRPFIPSPLKPSPLPFPSLAICTNAARSCIHVLDVPFKRNATVLLPNQLALFTSGIVLLMNIWGIKRSGLSIDPTKEMADVHKCMKMLKSLEPRWHIAGRLWDILHDLASAGHLPLPRPSPIPSNKRQRDTDVPFTSNHERSLDLAIPNTTFTGGSNADESSENSTPQDTFPQLSGHQEALQMPFHSLRSSARPMSIADDPPPIHTEELGGLPLHHSYRPVSSNSEGSNAAFHSDPFRVGSTPHAVPRTVGAAFPSHLRPSMTSESMFPMSSSLFEGAPGSSITPPDGVRQDRMFHSGIDPASGTTNTSTMTRHVDGALPPAIAESNILATMWSSAPQNFEWDDWGMYVNSVSGSQGLGDPSGHGEGI